MGGLVGLHSKELLEDIIHLFISNCRPVVQWRGIIAGPDRPGSAGGGESSKLSTSIPQSTVRTRLFILQVARVRRESGNISNTTLSEVQQVRGLWRFLLWCWIKVGLHSLEIVPSRINR